MEFKDRWLLQRERECACVILESPIREKINYALRLEFPTSNNEAEYVALLARLRLIKEMRVE